MPVPPERMAIPTSRNFASCYMELCKQQRSRPLPVICVTLPHSLDFTTDRVKMDDWGPILNSLSLDRSLKSICVRSRYQCRKPLEEINSEDKARAIGKAPVVLTRYLLEWLSHSVGQCIRNSPSLTTLEFEGIPFPSDCLAVLCVGLSNTQTVNHLSLQRCYIGDDGCELICRTIADVPSVRSLNLSYCDLTLKSGPALAAALSRQKLSLYHEAWKQSLRYQEPNFEAMPGLRRLTLNDNPHLGDAAMIELIEAVRDSLWLKALDVQRCGLSDRIGKELLELLNYNSTLIILDVRHNVNLNEDIGKEIIEKVEQNNGDGKSEYRWLGSTQQDRRTASAGLRKRTENENGGKAVLRPKSAIAGSVRKPYTISQSRKSAPPLPNRTKRIKSRTVVLPSPDRINGQKQQIDVNDEIKPKMSLHLDLQAYIQPVMGDSTRNIKDDEVTKVSTQREIDSASLKNVSPAKIDVATQIIENLSEMESVRIENVQSELNEARAEYDRLLEEVKLSDLLLSEERERREMAEAKLQEMTNNLTELESSLKEKEKETSGFLLLSQQSLDEICTSFDRLLEMLENVTSNPSFGRNDSNDASIVRDNIKRRVASVIRKTKSENLRRGFAVDMDGAELPRFIDSVKKFAKSESDMRSAVAPLSTLHLERNIGDSADVGLSTLENRTFQRCEAEKDGATLEQKARAIFSRIISGDKVLNFYSHVN